MHDQIWPSFASYAGTNFIHNHPPPGHDLKGAETLLPEQSLRTKTLPSDRKGSQKPYPRDIKLENFTHISMNSGTI